MTRSVRSAVLTLVLLATLVPSAGTQTPDRDQRMQWWRDARFGMFIHCGEWIRASLVGDSSRRVVTTKGPDGLVIRIPGPAPDPVASVIVLSLR